MASQHCPTENCLRLNGRGGLSVAQKKCFCQVCVIGVKSGILCMSPASWKDDLSTRLLVEQCAALLKRSSGLLGCLVLCPVCSFLGEWPRFPGKGGGDSCAR